MGRLFDGPWPIIIIFLIVVIGAVVALVVSLTNKSRKADQAFLGTAVTPRGSATGAYGAPDGVVGIHPHLYMQGMSHRSTATTFGVIGLFVLGIVFGPLALVQANKAEALGVKATAGKVLGWISVAFALLWIFFLVSRYVLM